MQSLHRANYVKRFVIIVLIIACVIWINPLGAVGHVRSVVLVAMGPIMERGYDVGEWFGGVWDMVFTIGSLHEQNQILSNRIRELEANAALMQEIVRENDELRTLMRIVPREKYTLIGAEVIMRDSLGGNQWVMIDRGRDDGVREDMTVIVNDGVYVGRISGVDAHTAHVQLMTHPEHTVNVVGAQGGAEAIMRGNHGLSAVVEDIKKDARVTNGESFLTSHIGNRTVRGFLAGTIHNVATSPDALFQTGNLVPAVDLGTIHMVFVVNEKDL